MDDPLRALPGYALRRVSSALLAELTERLAELDLRPTEATVLVLVGNQPGITQSQIGRLLGIHRANMVPLAARLRERGLIGFRADTGSDGRAQALVLSDAGTALRDRAWAAFEAHEAALVARIPAEHRAHLLPILWALWPAE